MKVISLLSLTLSLSLSQLKATEPVDRDASPEARKLLEFLSDLPRQNKIIIGQQLGDNETRGDAAPLPNYHKYIDALAQPEKVGLVGFDYGYGWKPFKGNLLEQNEILKNYWSKGGLVTIMLSLRNPFTGGNANDRRNINPAELLSADSQAHADWMNQLDEAAEGLQDLQKSGVIVLWRPFHESNGAWFWWGRQMPSNPDFMRSLWKEMFTYYTEKKGLHNLLWVYSPSPHNNPNMGDLLQYYPGNEFVDLVGLDLYQDFFGIAEKTSYEKLISTGKPFVLAEFGPGKQTGATGQFDYSAFLKELENAMPKTCYALIWGDWSNSRETQKKSLTGNKNAKQLLEDSKVLSVDEIRRNRN